MTSQDSKTNGVVSSEDAVLGVKIPEYGFKVKMNHRFPEKWSQHLIPRLGQLSDLLPLFIRYFIWWIETWLIRRRKPFIDLCMVQGKQIYGVPLGGIGSGTIGRGFNGSFCRFQMTPGIYTYNTVHANQFILLIKDENGNTRYHKVLNGGGDPGTLKSWDWTFNPENGSYLGLYPRGFYSYSIPEEQISLTCKQISPVIPHNYKDSCFPGGIFIWSIENRSSEKKQISITFTFKNGDGSCADSKGNCSSQSFSTEILGQKGTNITGVSLDHEISSNKTVYGLGSLQKKGQLVTKMTSFDLRRGEDLWKKLEVKGHLDEDCSDCKVRRGELGVAVCNSMTLEPQSQEDMVFTLAWDQPKIYFNNKEFQHKRRYFELFKRQESPTGTIIEDLVQYSLSNYAMWDSEIEKWQNPVLNDPGLPDWFKSAIYNELYFVSDGGSYWFDYNEACYPKKVGKGRDIRSEIGTFGYLEAHEYRMFNTYDVHFYASYALTMLWPKLQLSLQYDIADAVLTEDSTIRTYLFSGNRAQRKVKDSTPHDLGDPNEDPLLHLNSYLIHDVSVWKDLNLKFVLQVYRDFKFTGDKKYLEDMLPVCDIVLKKSLAWDIDDDGLIENSGFPDQTYDTWIMEGASAYCGSLWLASLFAMIEMSKEIGSDEGNISMYEETLKKGTKSFHEKLWNGSYYNFDSSGRPNAKSIMSDQLCGHWFLAMCDSDDSSVFPSANVSKALRTIFENNVLSFQNGEMGAVNGVLSHEPDQYTMQSEEMWTGVTYGLASLMVKEGMIEEGFKTAEGCYKTVYEKIGMGYSTPEALYQSKKYRAVGYMRPLSIYAILHAWNTRKSKK